MYICYIEVSCNLILLYIYLYIIILLIDSHVLILYFKFNIVNLETVRKRGRPLGSRNKKRGRKSLKKTTVKDGCHNDEEVNLSLETGTSGTNNSCLNLSTTNNTSNNDCIFPANTTNNDSINLSASTSNPSNFPTPLTSTNINNTTIPTNTNTNNTQTPTDTNNIPTDTNHTTTPTSTNNNNNDNISTNDAIERTYKQFERQIRKGKKYSFLAKEGINDKNRNLKSNLLFYNLSNLFYSKI